MTVADRTLTDRRSPLTRAREGRNSAIMCAVIMAVMALFYSAMSMEAGFVGIAGSALFAHLAVRDQRRADAIFARGVAAALAESDVDISDLSEAA